jgi:hypothetical protein
MTILVIDTDALIRRCFNKQSLALDVHLHHVMLRDHTVILYRPESHASTTMPPTSPIHHSMPLCTNVTPLPLVFPQLPVVNRREIVEPSSMDARQFRVEIH